MTYLDAFAGSGSFGRDMRVQTLDDDICKWGTPLIAIYVAVDHMNNLQQRKEKSKDIESSKINVFKSVRFFFNDLDENNIRNLITLVDERFKLLGWKTTTAQNESYFCLMTAEGPFLSRRQSIEIIFSTFKFEKIPFSFPAPLFSLIDPCGIAQIPMEKIRTLMGDRKEIFINLMVGTLNR